MFASSTLGPPTASARAPQSTMAALRGAHLSPDTASVDVYLTAFAGHTTTLWLSSLGYGDVSPYRRIDPGVYAVSMRPHGAKVSSPPALTWTIRLRAGHAYTAAAVGMNRDLRGIVIADSLNAPPAGHGRLRVIQAASRAPRAEVSSQHQVVPTTLSFGSVSPYVTVPAGRLSIRATAVNHPSLATSADLSFPSGRVESLVLLDARGNGITVRPIVDAAGARTVPKGAVPAGGGGTAAPPPAALNAEPWVWIAVLAMTVAGATVLFRRRARAARPGSAIGTGRTG